jgi:hypothetical protein
MARHGRHRHAPLESRSRDGARASGVRQIIRTPTFALSVSVVAAAVLAFGTTQTYLRFSGSGPSDGCGVTGCANPASSPTPPAKPAGTPAVQVAYKTLDTWPTGFTGELTIRNGSRDPLTAWRLSIAYNGSHITHVSGAKYQPNPHSASTTLEPAAWSDPLAAGNTVRITYTATGTAHPPTACAFDGLHCRIRSAP